MIRLRLDLPAIAIAFTGHTISRALVQTPGGNRAAAKRTDQRSRQRAPCTCPATRADLGVSWIRGQRDFRNQ